HGRFLPGALLAGRYRIVAPLGKGGMGEVYRADDLKLGQVVALKFLPEGLERDEKRLERLLNEVRTARQVSHPNVCRVYDVGEVEGHHFLSMEFVDGEDLGSLLRRIGRLPTDKGIEIARQMSAGLAAAHDAGILHRDLKPSNIMIDGRGRARITDFGLAAISGEIPGEEIRSGTPAYMAPEQIAGKGVSQRSDLYSLGLVLYELFTGKPPFKAASPADLLRQQRTSSPASPSSVIEGIDPVVERLILRCLEADPARRPSSALLVASALPGGDPLAAALAAGETPSPEMVAAAGESEGLPPGVAAAALGGILIGLAALILLAPRTQFVHTELLQKPPEVLSEKAREIAQEAGFHDPPVDSLAAFDFNLDYLQTLRDERSPVDWPTVLGRAHPAVIRFRYRQSPRPLVRASTGSIGDWFADPPNTTPGMAEVMLDTQGRLIAFAKVPDSRSAVPVTTIEPDWTPLLAATGLVSSSLSPEEPEFTPPFYAERRAAWKGAYPSSPETPVRVEAASLDGHVVAFRVLEPWELKEAPDPEKAVQRVRYDLLIPGAFFLGSIVAAGVLAARNLRLGRGDRRGTLRFAVYLGIMRLLWILAAHHLRPDQEVGIIVGHLAWSLFRVGLVALFYLALEPYARRLWPRMLVSWMRLLNGRFRDPMVGRDALFGCLIGVALALSGAIFQVLSYKTGLLTPPPEVGVWTLESLRGARQALAAVIAIHTGSVLDVFIPMMILLIFRLLLKKTWLAVGLTTVAGMAALYPGSGNVALNLSLFGILAILWWVVLFRFGLLGLFVTASLGDLFHQVPLTGDLSAWYATPTIVTLLVVMGLAFFAFRCTLAGRRSPVAAEMGELPAS
ncbi:MAG: serine/threonine protein kinase, partial [Acidobacteria bacterium]|nr:serine/threonine protein kinase [Acidobacteriota bacterium]